MNFPFIATIALLVGLAGLILALFISTWRYRSRAAISDQSQPAKEKIPEDFGPRLTSRRLRYVRWAFALLVAVALGFHVYWGLFATGPLGESAVFAALKNKRDQRNRREAESTLRGWIYDRHRDPRRALAKYRYLNGHIVRDYPLGAAAAHIVGYGTLGRGDVLLERAAATLRPSQPEKSWWQKLTDYNNETARAPVGPDMVLTIDFDLQKAAAEQLQGKRGAVVMLNPQTGELLAMASSPSFDPSDVDNDVKWQEIWNDAARKPLLNRALDEYYLPGSTLKTMTAAAGIEARLEDKIFTCKGDGWAPPGSTRPIRDDEGESHGTLGLLDAYTHSCNQYFSQLGVEVERQRMGEAALRFGLSVYDTGAQSIGVGSFHDLWNTGNKVLSDVLAPLSSTFVAGRKITKYDLALESIGQGYVQLTPMQMAMISAAAANSRGEVMRPTIEMGRQPAALSQAMSPETAAKMRTLMASVVQRGTAAGAFGTLVRNAGLTAGGKTGTAQRDVPAIDPKTGKPVTYVDSRGRTRVKMEEKHRIDSWFIGFAPVENPKIAWAVIVEGGGYGSRSAAPIAGNLVVKAKSLGLLNEETAQPKATPTPSRVAARQ
ncbi:MAG TPA: penicillin-binding transpeptidase domain-containing protein [Blastocatellia bacterium]|nr:penicillin-binding transpeptidase domain-containing protein [Blastocatellia bacterium]